MPKNQAFEEKQSNVTKEPRFFRNFEFLSSWEICQLKMENNVLLPLFFISHYKLLLNPYKVESHRPTAGK